LAIEVPRNPENLVRIVHRITPVGHLLLFANFVKFTSGSPTPILSCTDGVRLGVEEYVHAQSHPKGATCCPCSAIKASPPSNLNTGVCRGCILPVDKNKTLMIKDTMFLVGCIGEDAVHER